MTSNQNSQGVKIGVYICYCGGNISDHVDVEAVRERIEQLPEVSVARTSTFMCSDPGQELIIQDIREGTIDRVVVASCAPDLHQQTFMAAISRAGLNAYLYEHANIREQVSWVHHGPEATAKATRLVAAAVTKAAKLKPLQPIDVDTTRHVTVIGGGLAGLKAAAELADRGIEVTLVEKSPYLGGKIAQYPYLAPSGAKVEKILPQLTEQVLDSPMIEVHICAEVTSYYGYIGQFDLKIAKHPPTDQSNALNRKDSLEPKTFLPQLGIYPGEPPVEPGEQELRTGAIILGTGFNPYTPRNGEYGYGSLPEVVTLPELFHELARCNGEGKQQCLHLWGREIRSLVMIHCVGSRQIPGIHEEREDGTLNEHCSRTCCTTLINAANSIREAHPGTQVFNLYRDIRTYGRGHEELYERACNNGVRFLRFNPEDGPEIVHGQETSALEARVRDTLTFGEEVRIPADLVVLGVGMEPGKIGELSNLMKLPVGSDGFLQEVHPKLRPVEIATQGLILAGTCQAPMDTAETSNSAACAAAKATALLDKGYIELDPFVAEVDERKCRGHGYCVQACLKDGALILEEREDSDGQEKVARINQALCLGCGACVAACPEQAIELKGSTLEQYRSMVSMIVRDDLLQASPANAES